jgi:hypothetical protein
MTAALTPALALAYLHELSADVRAAIVLDAAGNRLAGPESLVAPARALLAEGALLGALTDRGGAFGARDDRHGVVAATGPLALPRLVLHDLARVLAALDDGEAADASGDPGGALAAHRNRAPSGPPATATRAAAEAILTAL